MRVIHVITRLIVGGAQENTVATVLGLRERPDIEVKLLSGPTLGREGSLERGLADVPGLLQIIPHLVRPLHPWHDGLAFRRLTQEFRASKPDLVHTHSGKAGFLGRCAARKALVPVVVHTIHGPSFGTFQSPVANHLFRRAEEIAGNFTTHFITVADAMTQQYLKAGIGRPEQYSRIRSGFDLEPFLKAKNDPALRAKLGLASSDFVIGKIGRLFKLKGHAEVFEAAQRLIPSLPQIKFLFVGDGPWRGRFESEVQSRGLAKHFVFAGLVAPAEVPSYVGIMDMLIHLSQREGLARALPQALAAGRPLVAFDIDGAREVCLPNETGFLISPDDPGALDQSVRNLARDPALRKRLGDRGRELVSQQFSIETMLRAIEQLYRRLLPEPGR